ncbi:NUDIX domain-containing protein [Paracoccus albus]|uniref:NUDIX domain-containing protein n=1 Tax=Paracoccus albus TaxID=3017784 RepID=UPI0022F04F08|nr:NUDIX domain-containing protein [Paracoccus albus]WBU61212.1 NUDIX domain-containing protein [Paracoccus albus]
MNLDATGREILLVGPLASAEMMAALGVTGHPTTLPGTLHGGADAGLGGDWPALRDGPGEVVAMRVQENDDLRRYLHITGLSPVDVDGQPVFGLGKGGGDDWQDNAAPLMARAADMLLSRGIERSDQSSTARLRRLAEIAAVRHRAESEAGPAAHLPAPDGDRVEVRHRREAYGRYFSVEEIALRHRRYDGGWSPVLEREVFISADASLLLPYDPVLDCVLLISQFRIGPLARGQAQCWMLEPVAGRVDAGEAPADAARREAVEEAGLDIGRLYALPAHYPTPGANSEYYYPFIAAVDLSEHETGQGFGVADEGEDIATHIIPRAELLHLAETGQIQCGPLITMALMLDRMAERIRADMAGT